MSDWDIRSICIGVLIGCIITTIIYMFFNVLADNTINEICQNITQNDLSTGRANFKRELICEINIPEEVKVGDKSNIIIEYVQGAGR